MPLSGYLLFYGEHCGNERWRRGAGRLRPGTDWRGRSHRGNGPYAHASGRAICLDLLYCDGIRVKVMRCGAASSALLERQAGEAVQRPPVYFPFFFLAGVLLSGPKVEDRRGLSGALEIHPQCSYLFYGDTGSSLHNCTYIRCGAMHTHLPRVTGHESKGLGATRRAPCPARRSCLSQRGMAPCRQAGLGQSRKKAPSTSHSIMLRCGSAQNKTPAKAERCSCQTGTRPILRLTGGASDLMRRRRSESRLSALPIQGRMLRAWPNRSAVPVAQGGT